MKNRILILVLSSKRPPWDALSEAQRSTWDSVKVDGVETLYYCSGNETKLEGKVLTVPCEDTDYSCHWRLKLALDYAFEHNVFDYVFCVNAATYVDKSMLLKKLDGLPGTGVFKGRTGVSQDGIKFVSGMSALMSRDCADIVRTKTQQAWERSEYSMRYMDVNYSKVLSDNGVEIQTDSADYSVYYAGGQLNAATPDVYCYWCKSDTSDRNKDVQAFDYIFKKVKRL